jgi:hypothetical protein
MAVVEINLFLLDNKTTANSQVGKNAGGWKTFLNFGYFARL